MVFKITELQSFGRLFCLYFQKLRCCKQFSSLRVVSKLIIFCIWAPIASELKSRVFFSYGFVSLCDKYKFANECFPKVLLCSEMCNMLQKAFKECSVCLFSLEHRLKSISTVWIPSCWNVHWLSTPLACVTNLQLQNFTTIA